MVYRNFNGDGLSSSRASTLVELLRSRAINEAEKCGYIFLEDGEAKESNFTYEELDREARAIGALLQRHCRIGDRVLLLYSPGLDFISAFFGCLYAGLIAIPVYPPHPTRLERTLPRLKAIVENAELAVVLTTSRILARISPLFVQEPGLTKMQWLVTDEIEGSMEEEWREPGVDGNSLILLQYTSGSTGTPKGVMLTHRNLLHNSSLIRNSFNLSSESRGVVWVPPYHDMGLIGGILQPLYTGFPMILMSPAAFLQRPFRWLQAISNYRGTVSSGPNFAYELCINRITPEQKASLDLSSWDAALNGAEPIRQETLERFVREFEPSGFRREAFYPTYGLAEASLLVSGSKKSHFVVCSLDGSALGENRLVQSFTEDSRPLVSCGQIPDGHKVVIVDPETLAPCEPDRIGEIWVSGPSVAQGYWGRAEETEKVFRAYLAGSGEGPFVRTGDLGFLKDGELFVAGRLKDLIIIDGLNHYPQDIELTVEKSHSSLRPNSCAAFSADVDGQERLFVVAEVERRYRESRLGSGEHKKNSERRRSQRRQKVPHPVFREDADNPLDVDTIAKAIRQAVAEEHELDVYGILLLRAGTIPKTLSGKLQRHACRAGFLQDRLEVVAKVIGKRNTRELKPSVIPNGEEFCDQAWAQETAPSFEAIQAWLISQLSEKIEVDRDDIDVRQPFAYYGLKSVEAVSFSGSLEVWLGRELPPGLLYDYPTIESLARFLAGDLKPSGEVSEQRSERVYGDTKVEPVAIIGIGCRFPGANSPGAFWKILRDGLDMVGEIPADRWNVLDLYDPDPAAPGKMNTRWGGFLKDVDKFDPTFFGISPRETVRMDPQQRLLLEVAWEALEDAGQIPEQLSGKSVGVFVGISSSDYYRLQSGGPGQIDTYDGTGNALSIAANRLSYLLDLRGPSLAIDTACSSSLVAVHVACQSIWNGESVLALAGGVNLILSPDITINFTKAGVMAPDGKCKAFDARANGYVRSEGAGVVVLKPLFKAVADGDPIYAVIRGSAVNQDGRSNGLMAPNRHAQEAVLMEAYRRAGVSPGQIQYVEAHGTGTLLGDPIEAKALSTVLSMERPIGDRCIIGSVKTNIGHLEAAAGIAGLIKVALSLKNRAIPPSLHFENPNPHIPFDELPIKVQRNLSPWPKAAGPALAGVSSFGFGGTNSHVVLQEPPVSESSQQERNFDAALQLLPLSAHSSETLSALARAYRELLSEDESAHVTRGVSLRNLCYTAGVRRTHHNHRIALMAGSRSEMVKQLSSYLDGSPCSGLFANRKEPGRRPKIAFVFSGQEQHLGMGRDLFTKEPLFRSTFEQIDELFLPLAGWSLIKELFADGARGKFDEPEIIHPVIFALQVALAALWRSWGIEPDAVVGHSLGEIAAAHIAGALRLKDAVLLTFHRSQLMQHTAGQGGMAALGLSVEETETLLAGYGKGLSIAAVNGPRLVTISGKLTLLDEVIQSLEKKDAFCKLLPIKIASHSRQMDLLKEDLVECLQDLHPEDASIPIFSTVTGKLCGGEDLNADYWGRQMREPVRFADAIEQMAMDGYKLFLEIGAHPILALSISECLRASGFEAVTLASLKRGEAERAVMRRSLSALYTMGFDVKWDQLYPHGRCAQLPLYPWQRKRYWYKTEDQPKLKTGTLELEGERTVLKDSGEEAVSASARSGNQELKKYYADLSKKFENDSKGEPGKTIDQEDGYLRFVPFSEIIPGFSWISTWFEPERHRGDVNRLRDKHDEMRSVLFRGIDFSLINRCLDIGCGNSSDLILMAKEFEQLELHGYNISPEQIELGNRRIINNRLQDRIELFNRDSSKDEFPGNYELIIGFQVIHHIKAKQGVFSNIGRHLENGGFLVLSEIVSNMTSPIEHQESSAYFIPKRQWAELLAENHLRIIDCVDMSREIGNFLYDPNFSENLSRVARDYDEVTRVHLTGPDRLGELFRRGLASYMALTIQKDRYSLKSSILSANEERLNAPVPYLRVLGQLRGSDTSLSQELGEALSPIPISPQIDSELTRHRLLANGELERRSLLESYFCKRVSSVLGLALSELDPDQPINSLGLDSMMALELKNKTENNLGITIPIARLLEGMSVNQLITMTLSQLPEPSSSPSVPALALTPDRNKENVNIYDLETMSPEEAQYLLSNIDQLSNEEVTLLLNNALTERESEL